MGRETLKAMWLEHWLQIGKSQSLGRGLGHSTETLVSEAVRTDSFRGFVRFGLVSWEVLFSTIPYPSICSVWGPPLHPTALTCVQG